MVQCDSILRHNYSNYPLKNSPFRWQEYRDCYVIQRELFNLVQVAVTRNNEQKKKIILILGEFRDLFDQIYLAYYKEDEPRELERTGILANQLEQRTNLKLNKITGVDPLITCYLFEIARTMSMFNHSLLQLKFLEGEGR